MMLKSIILIAALVGVAGAETRTYDVHATGVVHYATDGDPFPSCGASARMLKDKHVIKIDDNGRVTINGFIWKALTEEPDLFISFHNGRWQKTYLTMDMYVNMRGLSGVYTLHGVQPYPDDPSKYYQCQDVVHIDGTAR